MYSELFLLSKMLCPEVMDLCGSENGYWSRTLTYSLTVGFKPATTTTVSHAFPKPTQLTSTPTTGYERAVL